MRRTPTDTILLCLSLSVPCLGMSSENDQSGPQAPAHRDDEPSITEKHTEPQHVAYLVHQGAYWTIGPIFTSVREYMQEKHHTGPMYIRYLTDPRTVAPQSLHTEIGFIIDDKTKPSPPYHTARRRGEHVARMVIDAPFATVSHHFAKLRRWADAHHYVAGPITEIYAQVGQRVEETGPIELLMTLQRKSEPIVPQTGSGEESTTKEAVGPPTPVAKSDSLGSVPLPTSSARPAPMPSVHDLARAGRFDLIAERMLPAHANLPPGAGALLRRVSLRIRAIAGTIERQHPDESTSISALAGAIDQRMTNILGSFNLQPLDQPDGPGTGAANPNASEMRAILHDLDTLMVQIGLEQVGVSATFDQLLDVAQRIVTLMDPDG